MPPTGHTTHPHVAPKPAVAEPVLTPTGELMKKIADTLAEYNNKEADIPLTHEYWTVKNQLRALNTK